MAPICADPRQIVISLNPARRKAVLQLVDEIIAHMASHLRAPSKDLGPLSLSEELSGEQVTASERIQKAAIAYLREWRNDFYPRLQEIIKVEDNAKIQEERRTRREKLDAKKQDTSSTGADLIDLGDAQPDQGDNVAQLQLLYPPVQTRLTTIPEEDRKEVLSCILLLILSTGKYSAHSRALSLFLASSLELPQSFLNQEETEIAKSLMESSTADDSQKEAMSAQAEAAKRQEDNKLSRFLKVGLASVGGAIVLGVTGGLAAPLVAGAIGGILGGVGLGGVASFLGIFWMNGALVGTLFGAYGAKMTGEMMDHYAKEVEDFRFIPLSGDIGGEDASPEEKKERRLRVTIGINGWLNTEDDITRPWRVLGSDTEVFALRYEMETLLALGAALQNLIKSYAWKYVKAQIIKHTVLVTLKAAMWPLQILGAASQLDNPFNRASSRSEKAGKLLADALINKVQGERPVTLIGYSLGAGAIHACLESLAQRHAFGLIENVVIIGAPTPSDPSHWRTLRTVVSGNIFNVYSENDMILGFMYRMHSLTFGVAGLQAIKDVPGVENLDLSENVSGHLRYSNITGEILRKCGFLEIKAGEEIPKDEVMQMKSDQTEGKLIDFDIGPPPESEGRDTPSALLNEGDKPKDATVEDDLRTLDPSPHSQRPLYTTSRPHLSQTEKAASTPALPTRPGPEPEPEMKPPLPRRRTDGFDHTSSWFTQRRPVSRDSNNSEDGGHMVISMVNNDDDD